MLVPTLVMGVLALMLLYPGCRAGGGQHVQGMNSALLLMLPGNHLLFLSFIVAGEDGKYLRVSSPRGSDCPCFFRKHGVSA
jgi:hypothetical protein